MMPNGGTHDTDGGGGDRRLTYPRMSREQEMHNARARLALAEREEYLKTRKWRESALFGAGPETMTSDDYETIHDVRRNIWTGGLGGFAAGLFVAAIGGAAYPALRRRGLLGAHFGPMEPRHRTAALLISAALGMAVGASTEGQKNSWRMTDIYSRGAQPMLSPYQKAMQRGNSGIGAGADSDSSRDNLGGRSIRDDDEYDSDERLREWGWDPVQNRPSVAPNSLMVNRRVQ